MSFESYGTFMFLIIKDSLPEGDKMRWKMLAVSSLTGVRIIESPFLVTYSFSGNWIAVSALLVVGIASDFYDGVVARGCGAVTEFGFWFDMLSDRVFLLAPLLGMSLRGTIPLWVFVILTLGIVFTDIRARLIDRSNMLQLICWWAVNVLIVTVIIRETSILFVSAWAAVILLLYLPLMFFEEKREELKGWIQLILRKKSSAH